MAACETCWGDAYALTRMLGGSHVDHYYALLTEREHTEAIGDVAED